MPSDRPDDPVMSAVLPVLPIKHNVLFPGVTTPFAVGRARSAAAVQAALASEEKMILVVAQRDAATAEPTLEDLHSMGTKALIKQVARTGEGQLSVLVQGIERVRLLVVEQSVPFLAVHVDVPPPLADGGTEAEALYREVIDLVRRLPGLMPSAGIEPLVTAAEQTADPVAVVHQLGALLSLDVEGQQALLEAPTQLELLRRFHTALAHEVQVLELRAKIASEASAQIGKSQREYLLRQQLRAIQQELGEAEGEEGDVQRLRQRLQDADLPDAVRAETEREIRRLSSTPPASAEYQVVRNYVELVLELPWRTASIDQLDLTHVRQVLNEDHYGIEEVKERIVEHLAVLKLNPAAHAPILCLVGPPGVGKTSLGQSIARALGRRFERFSLGGMHDEAELRGHRRTYVGALPGRIIQAIRRAGVCNPVLMLDEVDKVGRDFRGDPAAALLEVLDPAQNHTFRDHFLDQPFDLSKVFFITTANTLDTISQPLLDRMEVIRLPGYSEAEKLEIATRYLWPRRLAEAGLSAAAVGLGGEAIRHIISRYTREAGVRQLEQMLARLTRRVALRLAESPVGAAVEQPIAVTASALMGWLGPERFMAEEARRELPPGVATGLAWTPTGGEVLYVETTLLPGSRELTLTGQLGDVMQESARAARSYLWAHAAALGIDPGRFRTTGVHIHVPSGAVPKDGPSAGLTIAIALASAYLGVAVRSDTAMTGEISLSGLVLPVGGIKEKVLAARRVGIRRLILPRPNAKDLHEVPEEVRNELDVIFVETIDDGLGAALESQPAAATRATG